MEQTVLDFLNKYQLTNKTIIVGFSGGFDSMCLLNILHKLSQSQNFSLVAAHFNHNWRGEESKQEQENCKTFCENNKIKFYTQISTSKMKQTETVARVMRYDFFNKAIEKFSADALLTAHNKNDVAETVLYRAIKGTGIVGLKSIAEKRNNIYRPLLEITREEIENYCKKNELIPNDDSSNIDIKYKRNYIRHDLLPSSKEINPNVVDALVSLSKVAQDECNIIDEYLNYIKSYIIENDNIITERFIALSDSVKRKLIYEMLVKNNLEYDMDKILSIFNFIEESKNSKKGIKLSLTKGLWLYVSSQIIEIVSLKDKLEDEVLIRLEGTYEIGDYEFYIETYGGEKIEKYPEDNSYCAYIDLENIDLDFCLRTRQDGDIINPLGMDGSMKLKKYLISKSVPQHKKDDLLLLCQGEEVLWVAGLGLSNKIQIKKEPTHKIILRKKV